MFKRPPQDLRISEGGLCLRALLAGDASSDYENWLLGTDVAGMLNLKPGHWPQSAQASMFEAYRKRADQRLLGFFDSGRMIGLFVITMSFDHGTFSITHLIGRRQDRGKGASAKAMQMLLDYFFNGLGFAKAKCHVNPDNGGVLWSLHNYGWLREGRLEKQMQPLKGGPRSDLICLAKLNPRWQQACPPA